MKLKIWKCLHFFRYLYCIKKSKRVKRFIQRQEKEAKLDFHIIYGYLQTTQSFIHSTNSHWVSTRHCVRKWKYNDEKNQAQPMFFRLSCSNGRGGDTHSWNKLQYPPLYLIHHNKKKMWPVLQFLVPLVLLIVSITWSNSMNTG